jgi:23S rRNA (cytosine1962-C5)-methyltransferase
MIPFLQGQKTGWFYDHRLNRERLKHYVANQTVLDVFSYVGGWGIQAAMFGAKQVTCVETSELAGQFIKKNAALNDVADKVKVLCEDAFDALKRLVQEKKKYDVIVLDPPAFINRFKDRKAGTVAYQRLNELAVKLLSPNGILFTCSCSMHFSMEDMIEMLQRVAYRTESKLQLLERGHQGQDHPLHIAIPETNYLKSIIVRKVD